MFFKLLTKIRDIEKGEFTLEYGLIIALLAFLLIGILIVVSNGAIDSGPLTEPIKQIQQ